MNTLNTWLRLEQIDEDNPRFEEFMNMMGIESRDEVSTFASWCSFKIFQNGAAIRFNKHLKAEQRQGYNVLKFAGINIDALRFDDWFFTEINTIYLYELKPMIIREAICPHCFNELKYDHKQKFSRCTKCEYVLPS